MDEISLSSLATLLESAGFSCAELAASDAPPEGGLAVVLAADVILRITPRPQLLAGEGGQLLVDFEVKYPFSVVDEGVLEVARYVAYLNANSDLCGFAFNEVERSVGFRIVQVMQKDQSNPQGILALVGGIMMQVQVHLPTLATLARGEQTMNEILKELLQALEG